MLHRLWGVARDTHTWQLSKLFIRGIAVPTDASLWSSPKVRQSRAF